MKSSTICNVVVFVICMLYGRSELSKHPSVCLSFFLSVKEPSDNKQNRTGKVPNTPQSAQDEQKIIQVLFVSLLYRNNYNTLCSNSLYRFDNSTYTLCASLSGSATLENSMPFSVASSNETNVCLCRHNHP